MKTFKADIALLPVSGTYVMTADEAVKAALDIKPKTAIPMHYGAIVGSAKDAELFAQALKGKIEVIPSKPCLTSRDLSLAYTPGVAEPCREIHKILKTFTNTLQRESGSCRLKWYCCSRFGRYRTGGCNACDGREGHAL
jgi:hypothetical protein